MGIIHNIIVVEDVFEAIFKYLPDMKFSENDVKSFPVEFGYGDQKELNAFLKLSENKENKPYPLIWLIYPNTEEHLKNKVSLKNISFILAVDVNKSGLNKDRIKTSYKVVLNPLLNNIISVLTRANVINMKHEFKIVKHPNYSAENSNTEESKTIANWDAIKITFNCSILNTCLKEIKF